jgi:hypothetical protein
MDATLVQRAMHRATGADIHSVAGLVHEYGMVDRLAAAAAGAHRPAGRARTTWSRTKSQIEQCLRLYIGGNPLALAKRTSGYHRA